MNPSLNSLGKVIRAAMLSAIEPPHAKERPSTEQIYGALKRARPEIKKRFGDEIKCRYKGCPPVVNQHCQRQLNVLEYLWDFSFSRFDIPRAIEQCGKLPTGRRYELLFVAESELGNSHEICRDLLKLLEARATIRCLVYNQYHRPKKRQEVHARMLRVLRNHALFDAKSEEWLFVGLVWRQGAVDCDVYTLNDDASELVLIDGTTEPTATAG